MTIQMIPCLVTDHKVSADESGGYGCIVLGVLRAGMEQERILVEEKAIGGRRLLQFTHGLLGELLSIRLVLRVNLT